MRTKLSFPRTSWEPSLSIKEFCSVKCSTLKNLPTGLWTLSCPNPFSQGEEKCSTDSMVLHYMVNWVEFFCISELLHSKMKVRVRLIRVRPNFYMISNISNVSLGIVDCSLHTRGIALQDDYHKKRTDMLATTPVELNYLENLARTFIIPTKQNQFSQKNFLTMLHFVRLLLQ